MANLLTTLQKLAAVCSVALQEIDEGLLSRIRLLLSEGSPVYDTLVQEAALEAAIVLLQKYGLISILTLHSTDPYSASGLSLRRWLVT